MIFSVIICDGCGDEAQTPGTVYGRWRAHRARSELRDEQGWAVGQINGTDWCPSCRDLSGKEQ